MCVLLIIHGKERQLQHGEQKGEEMQNGNGLTKTRTIIGIISGLISISAALVTILYFVFTTKTGLSQIKKEFKEHIVKEEKKFAQFIPERELKIEFKNITESLIEIKSQLKNRQEEDARFREKFYHLLMELDKKKE